MQSTWWILILVIGLNQNAQARKRRQMGPRLRISNAEFQKIVEAERGLVIMGPKILFSGYTYLTRSGDYYYYTTTKQPLALPTGIEVSPAKQILL